MKATTPAALVAMCVVSPPPLAPDPGASMHSAARRFLVLLAVLAMAMFLAAGCGGSDSDSSKGDDPKAESADDDSGDDSTDEDADDEDSASEVAVEAGIDYEDAILPIVNQLKPLLQRYDTTTDKLIDGSIDVSRATEAFGTQAATATGLAAKVRAVDVEDDHLADANEDLAVAFDKYASAMTVMTKFNDGMSETQIEQTMSRATSELDEMFSALDTWSDALVEDPEGRAFTRTGTAFTEISTFIDTLG
jgi:hypothetical protein